MKKINKLISVFVAAMLMVASVPLGSVALDAADDSPISQLIIDDVTVIKNTHGHLYNDNYIYAWVQPKFTVVLKDSGEVLHSSLGTISINGSGYSLNCDVTEQKKNPWGLGEHQMTATLLGLSDTFTVTVVESPIEKIEASDVSVIENTNGSYNEKDGYYCYTGITPDIMLKYRNSDDMVSFDKYRPFEFCGETYPLTTISDQYNNHWEAGGTYDATVSLAGVSANYKVTVTENPVDRIEIDDVAVIENTHGSYDADGNYNYSFSPAYMVYLKDGRTLKQPYGGSIKIDGNEYWLRVDMPDQNKKPFETGKTYEINASIMNVQGSFKVTIKKSPVESIEIDDVTVLENTGGYYQNGHYVYMNFNLDGKVKLTNSNVPIEFSGNGISIDGEWFSIDFDTSSQLENPWTAGSTYEMSASLLGAKCKFNVTVEKTNIESVKFEDITILENTNGYFNGEYYCYNRLSTAISLFVNGKEYKSDGYSSGISINDNWFNLQIDSNSQTGPWEAGNTYKVNASIAGADGTFNVTIAANPIVDVKIRDCTVIKNFDHNVVPIAKVTYSDGTVLEKGLNMVNINSFYNGFTKSISNTEYFGCGVDASVNSGEYDFSATLNGKTYPFKVTVLDDPIRDIELIKSPDKTTATEIESADLFGAVYKITYNDGDSENVNIENHTSCYGYNYVYLNKLNRPIEVNTYLDLNENCYKTNFVTKTVYNSIEVVECNIESVELKSANGKTLTLTVHNGDGTQYDTEIIDIGVFNFESNKNEEIVKGYITTKNGTFEGSIGYSADKNAGNYVYVQFNVGDKDCKSNILHGFDFKNSIYTKSNIVIDYPLLKFFNGKVTAKNIDRIINYGLDFWLQRGYVIQLSGNEVKQAAKERFAINDLDLSLSKMYNAQTDTYTFDDRYIEYSTCYLTELNYSNGTYNLVYSVLTDKTVRKTYVSLTDDFKAISIDTDYPLGDINCDDVIDILDLIMLKKCIATGDTDDIMSVADFNSDGAVNAADLTQLKKLLIS